MSKTRTLGREVPLGGPDGLRVPPKLRADPATFTTATQAMAEHVRNPDVLFIPSEKRFYRCADGISKPVQRGIHRFLRERFWVDYRPPTTRERDVYHAARNNADVRTRRPKVAGSKWSQIMGFAEDTVQRGIELGVRVHDQMEDYVRLNPAQFAAKHRTVNAHALKIMLALRKWHLAPLASEVPVWNRHQRWATAIDLVCVDTEGKLVLIELKTGYGDYFKLSKEPMTKPMDVFSASPLNQARMQILLPQVTLAREYGIGNATALVVHVTDRGVNPYYIMEEMYKISGTMYAMLSLEEAMCTQAVIKVRRRSNKRRRNTPAAPPIRFKTFTQARYFLKRDPVTKRQRRESQVDVLRRRDGFM